MADEVKYEFPEEATEEDQFHYISTMMDDIEESTCGELTFGFDPSFRGYCVEIFEHADEDDPDIDSWNGLELVDFYNAKTLKDVFDFLVERYV